MSICKPVHWSRETRVVDRITVGLFLILFGVLVAVPGSQWPWLALGLGGLLLANNAVRHLRAFRVHRPTLLLGVVSFAVGVAALLWPGVPILAVAFIAAGVGILLSTLRGASADDSGRLCV